MDANQLAELVDLLKIKGIIMRPEGKKLEAVRTFYGVGTNEDVVAMIDATVFGSAKNGMAFTNRGIYWHNDAMTSSSFASLTYDELKKTEISSGWMCIKFSGGGVFDTSGTDAATSQVLEFLLKVKDLACGRETLKYKKDEPRKSILRDLAEKSRLPDFSAAVGSLKSLKDQCMTAIGGKMPGIKDIINTSKDYLKYNFARMKAKPVRDMAYSFDEATDAAMRLLTDSLNVNLSPEIQRINNVLFKTTTMLNQIKSQFAENGIRDEQIEQVLKNAAIKS